MGTNPNLLSAKDVAMKLGIGVSTVWAMKARGELPEAVKLGVRMTRWKSEDIENLALAKGENFSSHVEMKGELYIRDQFAMAALTGICANSKYNWSWEDTVKASYHVADVMLEARKEKK